MKKRRSGNFSQSSLSQRNPFHSQKSKFPPKKNLLFSTWYLPFIEEHIWWYVIMCQKSWSGRIWDWGDIAVGTWDKREKCRFVLCDVGEIVCSGGNLWKSKFLQSDVMERELLRDDGWCFIYKKNKKTEEKVERFTHERFEGYSKYCIS